MKKLLSIALMLIFSSMLYAQNDVTKVLGIPVTGSKTAMINKLKLKGFRYNAVTDCLSGKFNDTNVYVYVFLNHNKVYRIMMADKYGADEASIKTRFNILCYQFAN